MKLNPDKECPFAPTKQYTESWERACPDFPGKASTAVRDLGIDHHSYHGGLPTLHARLDKLDIIAQHIGRLPLDQRHRANMARAVILGRGLHGPNATSISWRNTWARASSRTSKLETEQQPCCFTKEGSTTRRWR